MTHNALLIQLGFFPLCTYVQSFDHNGSCHLLYARLASDIKLGALVTCIISQAHHILEKEVLCFQ